jgi:16S rRNA (uracil1498-N3)-methyltransferase
MKSKDPTQSAAMPSAASDERGARGPRLHCPIALASGQSIALPPGAARHVQVLRLQPGAPVTLFDGRGGEWEARVERMGRSDVQVEVGLHHAVEREAARQVHLALAVPANDRMDALVEKAAELGAASIQPLMAERSVLRLAGERAQKKQAHWQAIAVAACEQCGRNRVPLVHAVRPVADWLAEPREGGRWLLSPQPDAGAWPGRAAPDVVTLLSGPEGGFSAAEEAAARNHGWQPVQLGPRILRADTAPLAALAALVLGD